MAGLCAGQSEPCGSPWLVSRALEAYSHGWVGAHVVADLLDQDVETTRDQLVAQGWAEPDAYTGLSRRESARSCHTDRNQLRFGYR